MSLGGSMSAGQNRLDRVLGSEFIDDLASVDVPTLRQRRREAEAEERELSFVRRVLQGRIDILRAELRRRAGIEDSIIDSLSRILADDRAKNLRHQRHAPVGSEDSWPGFDSALELATGDVGSDIHALSDGELRAIIESLQGHERSVSESRSRIHRVLDRLGKELTNRYRDGTALVDDLLASVRDH